MSLGNEGGAVKMKKLETAKPEMNYECCIFTTCLLVTRNTVWRLQRMIWMPDF